MMINDRHDFDQGMEDMLATLVSMSRDEADMHGPVYYVSSWRGAGYVDEAEFDRAVDILRFAGIDNPEDALIAWANTPDGDPRAFMLVRDGDAAGLEALAEKAVEANDGDTAVYWTEL